MARVLVTGGAGFVGSHVAEAFLARGDDVLVVDDLSSSRRENVPDGAAFAQVDIAERDEVEDALAAGADLVCHLAAQASVTVSVDDPVLDCTSNVLGTLNVCEAARARRAPVVFASTGGALYGDAAPRPTPEDFAPEPLSPYGASKLAGEAYVATWGRLYGTPNVVLRLGNVYGPRQNPHGEAGVVAIFTGRLHEGRAPVLYGHGKPTRDYIYVTDVVAALLAASGRAGVFNIATGVETDVLTIWRVLSEAAGVELQAELADLRPGELQHSRLDITRAAAELDWSPQVPIAEGLQRSYTALVAEIDHG
jgi:UDP-glucose 4-epimerase